MAQEGYKKKAVSGLLWLLGEKVGAQLISLIVQIILMRILLPEEFATVALTTVFINICNVFVTTGFGTALVQKKDSDELDFSSVFYTTFGLSIILYLGLFFAAPYIAQWLDTPILSDILRVIGIQLPISAFATVQNAYVSKNLLFKKFFWSTLLGTLISAVIGIVMAYIGCGVWAIVAQHLSNFVIDRLVLFITLRWYPKWMFSWKRVKPLFKYGWKLTGASLLDVGYNELRTIVIGTKYTKNDLAFYNKGKTYPGLIAENINTPINGALFPVISKVQDDRARVKQMVRRAITASCYLIIPCLMGLACIAPVFVPLLFTAKWLGAIPYLQIMCFVYAFHPIHTANLQAIKAVGRSDLFLVLETIKKVAGIAILLATMWFGVIWIAVGAAVSSILSLVINSFPNRKLLNYSIFEQVKDILPYLGLSVLMGAPVYAMNYLYLSLGWNMYLVLAMQIVIGVALYVGLSMLFKLEIFKYLLNTIKEFLHKNKKTTPVDEIKLENEENCQEATEISAEEAIQEEKSAASEDQQCDDIKDVEKEATEELKIEKNEEG